MKEQIDEMTFILSNCCDDVPNDVCENTPCNRCRAKRLYNAGYRKQKEGEWKMKVYPITSCSVCGILRSVEYQQGWNFCPNCGAYMKGCAE